LQLAPTRSGPVYLIDCFAVDPTPLWKELSQLRLVVHNSVFDLQMLARLGFEHRGPVVDTLLLSQLLTANAGPKPKEGDSPNSLDAACARFLGLYVPKEERLSDWTLPALTDSQLAYAALDAWVLCRLEEVLRREIKSAWLDKVAALEAEARKTILRMSLAGARVDEAGLKNLHNWAMDEADRLARPLARLAPPKPPKGSDLDPDGLLPKEDDSPTVWCWQSNRQRLLALRLAGCRIDGTAEEVIGPLADKVPLVAAYREWRDANKFEKEVSQDWFKGHLHGDRCHADWWQIGALTGRMSCRKPPLQQVRRKSDKEHVIRRMFVAPPGRLLVKGDLNQVELRIAAVEAEDSAMIAAYRRGDDLHTLTARKLTGRKKITDDERKLANPVNFGLIYGLGPGGLIGKARGYGIELTPEQAAEYRDTFFRTWEGITLWHKELGRRLYRMQMQLGEPAELRTRAGRRILLPPSVFRDSPKTGRPSMHKGRAANLIIQGTGGDCLKAALGLLYARRHDFPTALPVLAVHDEIVLECDEADAPAVAAWLKGVMEEAAAPLLAPVPAVAEVSFVRTWGGN
jgi:DNA polymerase-1